MGVREFICEIFSKMWVTPFQVLNWNDPHAIWSTLYLKRFATLFLRLKDSKDILHGTRCIYLINHQGLGDFTPHDAITDFQGNFLSKNGVKYVFPLAWLLSRPANSIWFFDREKSAGKLDAITKLYSWIDSQFNHPSTMRRGLIVYPEGTRSGSDRLGKLKTGMIHYAYSRNIPVQCVASLGQLDLINERTWSVAKVYPFKVPLPSTKDRPKIRYCIANPLYPSDFPSKESFVAAVCQSFTGNYDKLREAMEKRNDEEYFDFSSEEGRPYKPTGLQQPMTIPDFMVRAKL